MRTSTIELLALTAGLVELPEHLRRRSDSDTFWSELEATPEDRLTEEQRELILALGITP